MANRLWLMDGSPLPRSGFHTVSQQTMNFELPHDVVSTCAKRDEPPSRRRPANPSSSSVSFFPQNLQNDGRRLRGILFIQCLLWTVKIRVHSCEFVVLLIFPPVENKAKMIEITGENAVVDARSLRRIGDAGKQWLNFQTSRR